MKILHQMIIGGDRVARLTRWGLLALMLCGWADPALCARRDGAGDGVARKIREGELLYQLGRHDEAEKLFREVVRIDPRNDAAYYYLRVIEENRPFRYRRTNAAPPFVSGAGPDVGRLRGKLREIVIPSLNGNGLPLGRVLAELMRQARRHDPESVGINILVLPDAGRAETEKADAGKTFSQSRAPEGERPVLDAQGNPIGVGDWQLAASDLLRVKISLDRPLANVSLKQALNAIVKNAETPLQYQVETYAVVIRPDGPDAARLATRVFKVDPVRFEKAAGFSAGEDAAGALDRDEINRRMREALLKAGFGASGTTVQVFYNRKNGYLLATASKADLEIVRRLIERSQKVDPNDQ